MMNRRWFGGLFLAGLLAALIAASFERAPGYMDADYYFAGALRIVDGKGDSEPYLWNYFNAPAALPVPSFSYWMPLSSFIAVPGLVLARTWDFFAARLFFLLLFACVPPLTALLAERLGAKPRQALLAGLLALFPGFYLPYIATTDSFSIYMVLGAGFFLTASNFFIDPPLRFDWRRLILLGIISGLMHMARADGLFWLGAAGLVGLYGLVCPASRGQTHRRGEVLGQILRVGGFILMGYFLVAWPWYMRNLNVWGSLLPPGGSRAIWITEYEQTMIYPPELLTPAHWLAAGLGAHLQSRLDALGSHLQTAVAVQGEILLFPFIAAALWNLRRLPLVRLGSIMWLVTIAVMTLVFPFAGVNGGFFHSGAALQPLFWSLAPLGVEQVATWYAARRRFESPRRLMLFLMSVLIFAVICLSIMLYYQRVIGTDLRQPRWESSHAHYQEVSRVLDEAGAGADAVVMVNNPPGFWLASGRPAAVIPYGDEHTLISAALRYRARYVILETNNPRQLSDLYHNRVSPPELEYMASVGSTKLFLVRAPGE